MNSSSSVVFDDLRWLKTEIDGEFDNIDAPYVKCNLSVNRRVYLCMGEIWKLPVDAMVLGQNESLSDRQESGTVFTLAGPITEEEVIQAAPCGTGDSVICSGGNLCPYLILSVCPKFTDKYMSACENSLYSAYKSALLLAAEKKDIRTIAFSCIYLNQSEYPRDKAAHVALRTIRRFLEHDIMDSLEHVIFCVAEDDFQLYNLLMTAYFPRNEEEIMNQVELMPEDIGDEWGDTASLDRALRITSGPQSRMSRSVFRLRNTLADDTRAAGNTKPSVANWPKPVSMLETVGDRDKERHIRVVEELAAMTREERLMKRFEAMAKQAMDDPLNDIAEMKFLDFIGRDKQGRTIVLITASYVKIADECGEEEDVMQRMLLFVIKRMDELKGGPYVIVYALSGFRYTSPITTDWLTAAFEVFSIRYSEGLHELYVLHNSATKSTYDLPAEDAYMPFLRDSFWSTKYLSVSTLKDLGSYMRVSELVLPYIITHVDRYYAS